MTHGPLSSLGAYTTYHSCQTLGTQRTRRTSDTNRSNGSCCASRSRPHLRSWVTLATLNALETLWACNG